MTFPYSPDDRPDPADQHAVRARVPDHVSRGVFSTGVIVMTAPTEFVIDFIQNLGRPHQVVARIVMPHPVLPQFVDALMKNIDLYRGRYGNLPQPNLTGVMVTSASGVITPENSAAQQLPKSPNPPAQATGAPESAPGGAGGAGVGPGIAQSRQGEGVAIPPQDPAGRVSGEPPAPGSHHETPPQNLRRASAQEIYDDLKLRDEILSGSYANAVMIGHGPHEFSFDFITNFYPHSAVSARVYLAAGQVARLADSLRGAWDQIRHRFQQPPDPDAPPQYPNT